MPRRETAGPCPPETWRKRKTPLIPGGHKRRLLAVPLSFLACRTGNEVHSGGITRRAPGRTSRSPAAGPLSAGEGPSLSVGKSATFPFTAPYSSIVSSPRRRVKSKGRFFRKITGSRGHIPSVNLPLTDFQPPLLAIWLEIWYAEARTSTPLVSPPGTGMGNYRRRSE